MERPPGQINGSHGQPSQRISCPAGHEARQDASAGWLSHVCRARLGSIVSLSNLALDLRQHLLYFQRAPVPAQRCQFASPVRNNTNGSRLDPGPHRLMRPPLIPAFTLFEMAIVEIRGARTGGSWVLCFARIQCVAGHAQAPVSSGCWLWAAIKPEEGDAESAHPKEDCRWRRRDGAWGRVAAVV